MPRQKWPLPVELVVHGARILYQIGPDSETKSSISRVTNVPACLPLWDAARSGTPCRLNSPRLLPAFAALAFRLEGIVVKRTTSVHKARIADKRDQPRPARRPAKGLSPQRFA